MSQQMTAWCSQHSQNTQFVSDRSSS